MKILCSYSGIEFTCEHFPGQLYSRESSHPIFQIPQRKLITYLSKWSAHKLTPIDSYLLFIATLRSSELVNFRVSTVRTLTTDSIVAQNMESLFRAVIKLNTVSDLDKLFPQFVISPETRTLSNVHDWIDSWEESFKDFKAGKGREIDGRKLAQREMTLERLIKSPHKTIGEKAPLIADWAVIAGRFPSFSMINPFTLKESTCAEYWRTLIVKASKNESLFSIRAHDLEELIEHCEEHIPAGSIYSNELYKIIRYAMERRRNFLGDPDIKSGYEILNSTDSVEDANIRAMIQSAPDHLPRAEEYESKFQFMRATARWNLAQKYLKEGLK